MKSCFSNDRVPVTLTQGWDENSIKYDVNGNIQALRRDSSVQGTLANGVLIDQLKYTYNTIMPDQLYTVYDSSASAKGFIGGAAGSHYTYDANGNLTSEPYQGITHISYDVLNRTDTTVITVGSTYITYTYNAAGMLLRKKAYNSGTLTQTDYIGGFVYTGNGTTQTLAYAPMPEGRLLGTALTQEFVIADPQGNARVAFQNVSGVAKVTQENSYYGYGLLMPGTLVGWSAPPNKNLYNGGSEWQNDTKAVNAGVPDYYQTYFRNYDPALARFVAVDPMAEGTESMGVFQYSGDNPVMGNDPGGDKSVAPGASAIIDSDVAGQAMYQNSGFTDWVENQQDIETSDNYQSYQQALASTRGSPEQLEAQQARSEADMATPGSTDMVLQAGLFAFNVRNNTASTGVDVTVTITPTGLTIESNRVTGVANPDYVAPAPGQMPTTTQYMAQLVNATAFFPLGTADESSSSSSTLNAINDGVGAFGVGWGVKGAMIDYAVLKSGAEVTKALSIYGKVTDAVGVAGGLFAMGISSYNMYNQYEENHDVSDIHIGDVGDFTVGAASVAATIFLASNPIGWMIGAGAAIYFTGRFIYQETN